MFNKEAMEVRDTLDRLSGVEAQCLGGDRITATLRLRTEQFDTDQIRQHPLIRDPNVPKEPGVRSTVCLDDCGGNIILTSHFPNDLATIVRAAHKNPLPVGT